jgi:hypothetical protein
MLHCEGATAQTTGVGNSDWEGAEEEMVADEQALRRGVVEVGGGRGQRESEEEVEAEADM